MLGCMWQDGKRNAGILIRGTQRSQETKVHRPGFHQGMGAIPLQSFAEVQMEFQKARRTASVHH